MNLERTQDTGSVVETFEMFEIKPKVSICMEVEECSKGRGEDGKR